MSIGGLEKPPPVTNDLLLVSLVLDGVALLLSLLISWQFMLMMFIFGLVSKAYSHPAVRIKKYPVWSWLIATLFQGAFTFLAVYMAVNEVGFHATLKSKIVAPALLATGFLMGFYPMTQIYQHEEDGKRGDMTLSRLLGIRGTFVFTAMVFLITDVLFFWYFATYISLFQAWLFQLAILVPVLFFLYWLFRALQDEGAVNYKNAMFLNLLGAGALNLFFLIAYFLNH
jgi:1,4-dihydroxy-2-naphthoate octaprenyltransferase